MRALLVLFALALGCGTATTADDAAASGSDTSTGLDAATTVDASSAADSGSDSGTPCAYVDTIDSSCSTDADCAVGLHQTSCCGSSIMIGFRNTQQSLYATDESACMATYPACGCPASPPTTDSGETVSDTGAVHAACVSVGPTMRCETYVTMRPPNGR